MPTVCETKAKEKTLDDFDRSYKSKKFSKAKLKIELIYNYCKHILNWSEQVKLANEYAILFKNLKKSEQCLEVLRPFKDLAEETEADIEESVQDEQKEFHKKWSKITRHNLKLCQDLK